MNFFSRKDQKEALEVTFAQKLVDEQVAPGTQLHYDSELIGRLRSHHDALFDLSIKARDSAQAAKFDETKKCVQKFRLLLNEHLLEKNLRLYTYLGCCLKSAAAALEYTREMRRETAAISRKATLFITHYSDVGVNDGNRTAFLEELAQTRAVLNESFAREERTLYTMYQPPHAYLDSTVNWLPAGGIQPPWDEPAAASPVLPAESAESDEGVNISSSDDAESSEEPDLRLRAVA